MFKKALPIVLFVLFGSALVVAFRYKNSLNNFVAEQMKKQVSPELTASGKSLVNSLYNYTENGQDYDYTLLEFGSNNCAACSRMEKVLEEVRGAYSDKVNVVFYHVMKPESQDLIQYYGISAIPIQIVLDKKGKEVFKHYGYISFKDLSKQFQ